jgi:hypothetical protein
MIMAYNGSSAGSGQREKRGLAGFHSPRQSVTAARLLPNLC